MQEHLLVGKGKQIKLRYPDCWDEMNRAQAVYAGRLLDKLTRQQITVDQFRKLMVDCFIRRDNRGNGKIASMDKSMDMWANEGQLMDTMNFFFKITKDEEVKTERFEVLPTGINNPVPNFRHRWIKYTGPGDFLNGMTFSQFKDGLAAANKYMETLEPEWLTRLLAVCYLPKGVKYRMEEVDKRAARFKKVDIGIKQVCFSYLMGCMHNLRTDGDGNGIEIDGINCRFSLLFRKSDSDGGESIGLTGVLMSLAESGVFGNIRETADADVWDVLTRLYQLELQRREMEKRSKK